MEMSLIFFDYEMRKKGKKAVDFKYLFVVVIFLAEEPVITNQQQGATYRNCSRPGG